MFAVSPLIVSSFVGVVLVSGTRGVLCTWLCCRFGWFYELAAKRQRWKFIDTLASKAQSTPPALSSPPLAAPPQIFDSFCCLAAQTSYGGDQSYQSSPASPGF